MSEIRILHLDADPAFAEIVQGRLRLMNPDFAVTWVRNPSGFRAALALGGFEIILSDFGLPQYPGLSLLQDARKACPGTPFLFLSSVDDVESAVASIQAGACGYVLKSDLEGLFRMMYVKLPALGSAADAETGIAGLSPDGAGIVKAKEAIAAARGSALSSGRSKERILADLSHALRTPLNGVMGMAGLLAETSLDEKQLRYLRILQSSSQSLLRILNDSLEQPLIEEDRLTLEDPRADLRDTFSMPLDPFPGSPRKQYPLRILVAEDNDIGQMVICSLLDNLGQRARVVTNGKAAVEAYRKSPYDLVFMDCQMPEMDGYEAVGLIRRLEKETGKRPAMIVAMTADVLSGTRERCVEAGMDGYLSKPILMESLEDLIGKASAGAWQDGFHARGSADMPEAAVSGDIDLDILDRLRLLSAGDVPGMFQELVSGYIEQSEAKLEELYGHVEAGDSVQVAGVAHGLKGLSLNFGALAMARGCDTLQRLCEAGAEKCRPILRALRETKVRTNAALSDLAGLPVREAGPGIPETRA